MLKALQKGREWWGKREIAHGKQFLLFPHYFQNTCTEDMWKQGLVWERVTLSQTTNFRLFQTERVSNDNFNIDGNG